MRNQGVALFLQIITNLRRSRPKQGETVVDNLTTLARS